MKIARVIGTVTLSRSLPSFVGARLRVVVTQSLADLKGEKEPATEFIVAWDEMGAGIGDQIALSEGGEAAQPFRPEIKPVDAYAAAILDAIQLDPQQLKLLETSC